MFFDFKLGPWKEIIAPDGKGFWFVFKARWSEHIEIYELHRNTEYGPKDKSDGIIISFHGPYVGIRFSEMAATFSLVGAFMRKMGR